MPQLLAKSARLIILALCCGASSAHDVHQAVRLGVADDYVEKYPQYNGVIGAYDVVAHVFAAADYPVKVVQRPAPRSIVSLHQDEIDIHIGNIDHSNQIQRDLLLSRLPLVVLPVLIYYRKDLNWQPNWPPDSLFREKTGKSVQATHFFKSRYQLKISQSPSFSIAAKMVEHRRSDYFIDGLGGFVDFYDQGVITLKSGMVINELYRELMYVFFQNNNEGAQLKKVWDDGQLSLLKNGQFREIYYEKTTIQHGWPLVKFLIDEVNKQHPNLEIPN